MADDAFFPLGASVMNPAGGRVSCLDRLGEAPWAEICFGDDPMPLLILLMAGSILFYPLMREIWPLIVLAFLLAIPLRAWGWCREQARKPTEDQAK